MKVLLCHAYKAKLGRTPPLKARRIPKSNSQRNKSLGEGVFSFLFSPICETSSSIFSMLFWKVTEKSVNTATYVINFLNSKTFVESLHNLLSCLTHPITLKVISTVASGIMTLETRIRGRGRETRRIFYALDSNFMIKPSNKKNDISFESWRKGKEKMH